MLGTILTTTAPPLAVSRDPNRSGGSHILFYDHAGSDTENSMLYGTPDDIADKLTSLQRVGIKYIILNIGGMSRDSLRSFAREIMPAFTDSPQSGVTADRRFGSLA
jgi:alkanesulfonate monooxygenase SsuD/methylene tetrahydromethanopterin reductase-like flavin-dependent oxidoreductase (luciferase family)